MRLSLLPLSLAATLVVACNEPYKEARIDEASFASELNVDLDAMTRTESGLYYLDLEVGSGTVAGNGSSVTVFYTGLLTDGTYFDERQPPRAPIEFTVGTQQVIPGFEEGMIGMRVGGTRKLIIPPSLAYGKPGRGPVPGNAILIFIVTLQDAR